VNKSGVGTRRVHSGRAIPAHSCILISRGWEGFYDGQHLASAAETSIITKTEGRRGTSMGTGKPSASSSGHRNLRYGSKFRTLTTWASILPLSENMEKGEGRWGPDLVLTAGDTKPQPKTTQTTQRCNHKKEESRHLRRSWRK